MDIQKGIDELRQAGKAGILPIPEGERQEERAQQLLSEAVAIMPEGTKVEIMRGSDNRPIALVVTW
jgi:hypothetical protein